MQNRYERLFPATVGASFLLILLGLALDDPATILTGLYHIVTMQDLLITDYVHIAGAGAALINCGLVTLISILLLKKSDDLFNGFTLVEMGLMAGFSLFGKNVLNIWPILLGTWLYAKYQKHPFGKHVSVGLLATSLSPLVSYMALGSVHASIPLGILVGIIIGFILPPLSAYTYKIQNGMNLYNMGFACGLIALMVVLLGFFLISALTMGNVENVIDAREEADKRAREGTLGGENAQNISHWAYGNRNIAFTADDTPVTQSDAYGAKFLEILRIPGEDFTLTSAGGSGKEYLQIHYNPVPDISAVNVFLSAANLTAGTTKITDPLERRNLSNLQEAFNRVFGITDFSIVDTVFMPARVTVPDPETVTK